MKNEFVFKNLLELTAIFEDMFRCELTFRLLDDKIELYITPLMNDHTYSINVGYDFKSDDIINKFKDSIVREALNCEEI